MSDTTTRAVAKPVPVPDELSEGFWAAAARGRLAIQRCADCGRYTHPPTTVCSGCFTVPPHLAAEDVSGRGRIASWTVVRQAFLPGFRDDVPYVVVVVELDEQPGLKVLGRLVDGVDATFAIGDRVEVTFEEPAPGVAVPAFRLGGGRS